mmetsp:Transcript_89512/g.172251  ORF Transcript_89512/g.172251 Transcript_89512/m.172251 type:complete len:235 (+) Transcript_89512:62-766(+)
MGKNKGKKDSTAKNASKGKLRPSAQKSAAEQEKEDEEMAAQVKEIEERLQEVMRENRRLEAQIRTNTVEAKRAELVGSELEPLPESARLYRQVGRTFLQQPKADIARFLKATVAMKKVESRQLQNTQVMLEAKMKSEAGNLRELLGPKRMQEILGAANREGPTAKVDASVGAADSSSDGMLPIWGKTRAAAHDSKEASTTAAELNKNAADSGEAGGTAGDEGRVAAADEATAAE